MDPQRIVEWTLLQLQCFQLKVKPVSIPSAPPPSPNYVEAWQLQFFLDPKITHQTPVQALAPWELRQPPGSCTDRTHVLGGSLQRGAVSLASWWPFCRVRLHHSPRDPWE